MLALAGCSFGPTALASLVDRGGGMLYDTVLDITWLADANFARTSGFDLDGRMTHAAALEWADNLVFGGFDDWRLPSIGKSPDQVLRSFAYDGTTDIGYNITRPGSELSYMYYVNLGLTGEHDPDGSFRSDWGVFGNGTLNGTDGNSFGERDIGLVHNLQAYIYWSREVEPTFGNLAATFHTSIGFQGQNFIRNQDYAWAVRDGDVIRVPEPISALLAAVGLGAAALTRRRVTRRQ